MRGSTQRAVLIAALAFFVAATGGVWLATTLRDREATLREATAETQAVARLLEEHAEKALESADALLLYIVDVAATWDFIDERQGQEIWAKIAARVQRNAQIGSAWIVDATGATVLESWGYPSKIPSSAASRDYFKAHLAGERGLFIEPAMVGSVSKRRRFALSRAIRFPDGTLRGVAVTGVYSEYFAELYRDIGWRDGGELALLTLDGAVMAQWPEPSGAAAGASSRGGASSRDGAAPDEIVATRRLESFPLAVRARTSAAPVLAGWRKRAAVSGGVALAATAGFSLLVAAGLRGVRREEAVQAELIRANEALDRANAELEARVAARTEALEQALAQKELLMREVNHRAKNSLQLASSLLRFQMAHAPDSAAGALLQEAESRLNVIARLHERLYRGAGVDRVDLHDFLSRICDDLHEGFSLSAKGVELTCEFDSCEMPIDAAIPLALALNELMTNAAKYGLAGRQSARVRVLGRRCGGEFALSVEDDGAGLPPDFDLERSPGLGMRLVRGLAGQLGGALAVERPSRFVLRVPLDGKSER